MQRCAHELRARRTLARERDHRLRHVEVEYLVARVEEHRRGDPAAAAQLDHDTRVDARFTQQAQHAGRRAARPEVEPDVVGEGQVVAVEAQAPPRPTARSAARAYASSTTAATANVMPSASTA